MVPGGDFVGILDRAEQLEAYRPLTLPAQGKPVSGKQRGFMHQAMRVMSYAVNAAFWNKLSRPMLPSQNRLPFYMFCPEREHAILKSSKFAGKAAPENCMNRYGEIIPFG